MEQFLQNILNNNSIPLLSALILGLLTAISPCPLATNITAIGFISKDIENQNRIFRNGLLYTLGRVISYTLLGIVLILILKNGTSMFGIQKFISQFGGKIIGPLLILVGLFMILSKKLNLPQIGFQRNPDNLKEKGGWGALWLGVLFALAFCPTSAVFYFGMLIPMAAVESAGYLLPIAFAVATALPVIVVAWILAYSVAEIGKFYKSIQSFEKWFRVIVAIVFLAVGTYYTWIFWIK